MLVHTARAPYYARGQVRTSEAANLVLIQHLTKFWPVPIIEGPAVPQGSVIDADEPVDGLDASLEDQQAPEVLGGQILAQKGELFSFEAPCATCLHDCNGVYGQCPREASMTAAEIVEMETAGFMA